MVFVPCYLILWQICKEGSENPPRLAQQAVEAVVLFLSICSPSITFTMFSVLPLLEKRQKPEKLLKPKWDLADTAFLQYETKYVF